MAKNSRDIDDDDEGGIDPVEIARALLARWRLIVAVAASVTAIAVTIALLLPTRYEATATVQIDPRKRTVLPLENVVSDLRPDAGTVESEVEVLKSRTLALMVIGRLGLREHPEFNAPSMLGSIASLVGLPSGGKAGGKGDSTPGGREPDRAQWPPDELLEAFGKRLKTARVRNSLVVEIRFQASEPVLAARIANALVDAHLEDQLRSKTEATRATARQLEEKLGGLRRQVAEAEQRVAKYKTENGLVDAEGQLLSEKQLARLMEQTIVARNQVAEAKARYDQLQVMLRDGRPRNTIADVLQSHTVRMLKDQLGKASRREAELLTRYGPRHPELIKVRAELADAKAQVDGEVRQIVANLHTELQVADARERSLAGSLAALKAGQGVSQAAAVRLRDLERDAHTSRQVLEAVLARFKQTTETLDIQTADSRVIERADAPSQPVAPKRRQIAMIGAGLGVALGGGLALVLHMMTPALLRREDAEREIGLPVLASLPGHGTRRAEPLVDLRATVADPASPFAEAVRAAGLEIDACWNSGAPRIILVASALAEEGATLAASNLAHHLAQTGRRTLLVDADLRTRRLSHDLGLSNCSGLIQALASGSPLEGAIVVERASGLAVLPAGTGGPHIGSPADFLARSGAAQRLAGLRDRFDVIVIDAPPLLPVVDARLLAAHADQIVLVTLWRGRTIEPTRRALEALGRDGARVAGLIVNTIDPTSDAPVGAPAWPWTESAERRAA